MVTKRAVEVLRSELHFLKNIKNMSAEYGGMGKVGGTISIRKPPRYVATETSNFTPQDSVETVVPLTMRQTIGVHLQFETAEQTLSIDEYEARFIRPAVIDIAQIVESRAQQALYRTVSNLTANYTAAAGGNTVGPITKSDVLLNAGSIISSLGGDFGGKRHNIVASPSTHAQLVASLQGLFNPTSEVSEQYLSGMMGDAFGLRFWRSALAPQHVSGSYAGLTFVVNGGGQSGSQLSITVSGSLPTNPSFNAGDVFNITGVFAVHPQTRLSVGFLQNFVVTADMTLALGSMVIPISPSIVPPSSASQVSQFQNVTAAPANGAAINMLIAANQTVSSNLAFHKDAFAWMCTPLAEVPAVVCERYTDADTGLSMRFVKQFNGTVSGYGNSTGSRLETLVGFASIYPELAVRVTSTYS